MIPTIGDHLNRRQQLIDAGSLNGIDYLELVPGSNPPQLRVYFLLNLPQGAYGLTDPPYDQVRVTGGVRIKGLKVRKVERESARNLLVTLDRPGDLSRYTLLLNNGALDPIFSRQEFLFQPGAEETTVTSAPAAAVSEPLIDYQAKDYQSLRTALTDFIRSRVAAWEDHPADLGTALLELMAYAGDELSYYQDAVVNEAWLTTARQRESVRRHAVLIDYRMHDGCAARTFVHVRIGPKGGGSRQGRDPAAGVLPAGTRVTTQPGNPEGDTCFVVLGDTRLHEDLNEMALYDWGSRNSRLPLGATEFDLAGALPLQAGDYLVLEEVLSPVTGRPAEADPTRRQVVRVAGVQSLTDPLAQQAVTRVLLDPADAVAFAFTISAEIEDRQPLSGITLVRGNLAPVEHGRPMTDTFTDLQPPLAGSFRVQLEEGPLTFRAPFDLAAPAADLLAPDPRRAEPRVVVIAESASGVARTWRPAPDLLSAGAFAEVFVTETAADGRATLRFGDGYQGRRPPAASTLTARYWTGNGPAGNVGADSLVSLDWNPATLAIVGVRNPIPARGGTAPEAAEQVKQLAPADVARRRRRSVTAFDYAAAAETHPAVARAVALFRWTGSWYTVQITVDPRSRAGLTPALRASIQAHVDELKLSGYDVEIAEPVYVPLLVEVEVEPAAGSLRPDVKAAVLAALSNRDLGAGRQGLFHPDRYTFGQPVYLSHIYAAVEAVPGVQSVRVTRFERYGAPAAAGGQADVPGVIHLAPMEIARLDNDPNYPELGRLLLTMRGGL